MHLFKEFFNLCLLFNFTNNPFIISGIINQLMKYSSLIFSLICVIFWSSCTSSTEEEHPAYSNPAIINFTQKIKKDPNNSLYYYQRAEALMQLDLDSLSIIDLKTAIKLAPDNVEYQYTLAILYMYQHQEALAVPILENILEDYTEHVSAYLFLSQAYLALKEPSKLSETLNKVEKVAPDHPELLYLKSEWALLKKDTTEAVNQLQQLTDLHPDYYKAWMSLASIQSLQKNPQFINTYERAFQLDTLDVAPYYEIGNIYIHQQDTLNAEKYFGICIAKDHDFTPAYMALGKIYLAQDSLEKAYRHFNLASQTQIINAEAYYFQSLSLEKAGAIKAAKDAIRQALIYDKNNNLYQEQWDKLFE